MQCEGFTVPGVTKNLLLILDNFEQLLAASPRLDDPPRLDEFYGEALGFRDGSRPRLASQI